MSQRIAIVIDSLAGGGAERVMLTLAQTLIADGHRVEFITLEEDTEHQLPAGLKVHCCFGKGAGNYTGFWRLGSSAAKLGRLFAGLTEADGEFDLILSNLDKSNLLMSRLSLPNLHFVVHNSIEEELRRQRKLGPLAYMSMLRAKKVLSGKHLVTVSAGIAREIIEGKRIRPAATKVIYNPFDFENLSEKAAQSAELPPGPYLIHVGRIAKQKRHDILLQALALTQSQIPLVLLCQNTKKALKLARRYGVEQRLILPGFQTNPYPWIREARMLVLSSDYEGLPTVLIEALALHTPVVSTDCPHGPNEILLGELAANLVPRRDPKALAAAIDKALAVDKVATLPSELSHKLQASQVAASYLALSSKG